MLKKLQFLGHPFQKMTNVPSKIAFFYENVTSELPWPWVSFGAPGWPLGAPGGLQGLYYFGSKGFQFRTVWGLALESHQSVLGVTC